MKSRFWFPLTRNRNRRQGANVSVKVTCVAMEYVDEDPGKQTDMERVSRKISKLYLESKKLGRYHENSNWQLIPLSLLFRT
ncbi:hypothetical protein EZV62_002404 [Acer yangbiense]|uniref:Uncharacterized protein n=1 Tax=Acer yangbiense TaxID=1000413 RepID=A0A5C7IX71_9ROSI|nr:hypothetical protein EZV62_002404 [Acer yangbiense]